MADEVAGELDRLFKQSSSQKDEDLVFAHPETGGAVIGPTVTRRFKAALSAGGLDVFHRFHGRPGGHPALRSADGEHSACALGIGAGAPSHP